MEGIPGEEEGVEGDGVGGGGGGGVEIFCGDGAPKQGGCSGGSSGGIMGYGDVQLFELGAGPEGGDGEFELIVGVVEVVGFAAVLFFEGAEAEEGEGGGVFFAPLAPSGEFVGKEVEGGVNLGAGDGAEGELGPEGFVAGVGLAVVHDEVGVVEEAGNPEFWGRIGVFGEI